MLLWPSLRAESFTIGMLSASDFPMVDVWHLSSTMFCVQLKITIELGLGIMFMIIRPV